MKRAALALILIGLSAGPAFAQGNGKNKNKAVKAVPPGQMPPAGLCRVWYDGVPPDVSRRRPTATRPSASPRDSSARVVYGDDSREQQRRSIAISIRRSIHLSTRATRAYPTNRWTPAQPERNDNRPDRRTRLSERYPYPDARDSRGNYSSEAFRKGYEDGVYKGREDVGDGDSFDPARHSWYKSADRGYNSRYGSKEEYRAEYRRGFLDGYENTHTGRQRSWSELVAVLRTSEGSQRHTAAALSTTHRQGR